ncbi:MAG: hypothetical protein ACJ761_03320 [Chloroflexota bacterium]
MASEEPIRLPYAPLDEDAPLERDLAEVLVAIELVRSGTAQRVRLASLQSPEAVAGVGAARAGAAGVSFRLERGESEGATITVGPVRPGMATAGRVSAP